MRTTLTLDEDVAIALDRIRERDALTLKAAVNEALRRGLQVMDREAFGPKRGRYELETWDSGGAKVPLDDIAEALAWAEGDHHR